MVILLPFVFVNEVKVTLDLCDQADRDLFGAVATNLHHVLRPPIPPLWSQTHNLRRRSHRFARVRTY